MPRSTHPDQAIDRAVALNATMLQSIRWHLVPDSYIRCNCKIGLPRRFRSSARDRASGAGRLALDPSGCIRRIGPLLSTSFDAEVDLRDVQIAARHADPRTTMRYDRARKNLDRHPNYILAAYMASDT
jgi:hypothetical protein